MNSLVIPVYKNEDNIPHLLEALRFLNREVPELEVVFVVDGSPDQSASRLRELLPCSGLKAQLLLLSRNFGSFAAIRAGLKAARGEHFAVMAADLQEPPELAASFFNLLQNEPVDIVIGTRQSRSDPFLSRLASAAFWRIYRRYVIPEMPVGGVDVFGCNRAFRDELVRLDETHSSLVALLFWMGFRRKALGYDRQARKHGKSAWTFRKKFTYLKDSIFSFTDAPIALLSWTGTCGILVSGLFALVVVFARLSGVINVPGYSATILTVIFFGALNLLGIGIVGTYAWRAYENTKLRPPVLVMSQQEFVPQSSSRSVLSR